MLNINEGYEERVAALESEVGETRSNINHAEVSLGVIMSTASLYAVWSMVEYLVMNCIA